MLGRNDGISVVSPTVYPPVLICNAGGEALRWENYQESAYYVYLNKVLWSAGEYNIRLRGGINAASGKQSILTIDTILALNNDKSPTTYRTPTPALSNKRLFARDQHLCAYCGKIYPEKALTRDHVIATSKGGRDIWTNVVTSCKSCNQRKDDMTLRKAHMSLLYVPYAPSYNEALILEKRRILENQMVFLLKGVSQKSRLHDYTMDGDFVTMH